MPDPKQSPDVAIYVPSLRGGGTERVMVTLANGFVDRSLKVDLVLAQAEGPYLPAVDARVRIVDLKSHRVLVSLPGLVRYLRLTRPRSMLAAMHHANVIAILARLMSGVPTHVVVAERSTLSSISMQSINLWRRLVLRLAGLTYRLADGVTAVSNGSADALADVIGLPRERIQVIYNPIDVEQIRARSLEPIDHPWLEPGQPPVILAVGRLAEAKDYPTLIRAFARLRQQRFVRLVILGEGELRAQLETQIQAAGLTEDVALPGFAENPFSWMRRASVFVLSSAWEGLPNVLMQAMACGTSVVSTDCQSGPAEILENGRWGLLVPVGDDAALASAMAEALDDPAPPDVQKRAEMFESETAITSYLASLQKCLDKNSP